MESKLSWPRSKQGVYDPHTDLPLDLFWGTMSWFYCDCGGIHLEHCCLCCQIWPGKHGQTAFSLTLKQIAKNIAIEIQKQSLFTYKWQNRVLYKKCIVPPPPAEPLPSSLQPRRLRISVRSCWAFCPVKSGAGRSSWQPIIHGLKLWCQV